MRYILVLLLIPLLSLEMTSQIKITFQATHGSSAILNVVLQDSILEVRSIDGCNKYIAQLKDSILTVTNCNNSKYFSSQSSYWLSVDNGVLYKIDSLGKEPFLLVQEFISPNFVTYIEWHRDYEYSFVKISKKDKRKTVNYKYSFWKCCIEVIITKTHTEIREYDTDGLLLKHIKSKRSPS